MRRTIHDMLRAAGLLLAAGILLSASVARAQSEGDEPPEPPLGLPPIFFPDDNPYTEEKAELGRLLYFDNRLSTDNTVSCASCHDPKQAFVDGLPVSVGIRGQKGSRNAPTVINRAYSTAQFWDGRAPTLEEQAKGPLANPLEMTNVDKVNEAHAAIVLRIREIPGYVERFHAVFGDEEITIDHAARAIATFERTILSGNAPFDRYQDGDESAMTESQVRGMAVFFEKAKCDACHLGFNFTDGSYQNVGIGMDRPKPDLGRFLITGHEEDRGAFKTPTLREIEHTGPYMHDGSMATLEEVVEHYDKGGIKNPQLSDRMVPLNLSDQEKMDLVAFMKALSGEGWQHVEPPDEFPR